MKKSDISQPSSWNITKIGGSVLLLLALLPLILDIDMLMGNANPAGGAELVWMNYDEGVKMADESGKKLLVDIYTDWCTWCDKMDADVYTATDVKSQIDKHFIPVKLNAESRQSLTYNGTTMTYPQFTRAIGVTGYPATLFLKGDQEPITLVPGYIPAERFAVILEYIGENHYQTIPVQSYVSQNGLLN